MPEVLFAACRSSRGQELEIRRVSLDGDIQKSIEGVFTQQMQTFFDGVEEEMPYDGRWKPNADELLTLPINSEARQFLDALGQNAIAIQELDVANLASAGIKALFTGESVGGDDRVLVQQFTGAQVLSRRFPLILRGNTFRRLTDPAFTLGTSLAFVIEGDLIKFRNFEKLRSILDVMHIYREATESEVRSFATHGNLLVSDVDKFAEATDQPSRKLIYGIMSAGILDALTVDQIETAASDVQLSIDVYDGKVVVPNSRPEFKIFLQFLDESRYRGPLSGRPYVAGSRRLA